MRHPTPGKYDTLIQFQRRTVTQDSFGVAETWENAGPRYWSEVRETSTNEADNTGQVIASIITKFICRYDSFTSTIKPTDRLSYNGTTYNITGRRELPGRQREIEFTGTARGDL
jgi:head-tail adaptor